jgi:hypothetical protein
LYGKQNSLFWGDTLQERKVAELITWSENGKMFSFHGFYVVSHTPTIIEGKLKKYIRINLHGLYITY